MSIYQYQKALQEYERQFSEPPLSEEELEENARHRQEILDDIANEQFEEMRLKDEY